MRWTRRLSFLTFPHLPPLWIAIQRRPYTAGLTSRTLPAVRSIGMWV